MRTWPEITAEFTDLLKTETRLMTQGVSLERLSAIRVSEETKYGRWMLLGIENENFRARFELAISHAGRRLGCPANMSCGDIWLYRFFQHLRAKGSKDASIGSADGGVIRRVVEASATYSLRWECAELEDRSADDFLEEKTSPVDVAHEPPDRKKLRDSYFANLPGPKIKILDVCWGAAQHYSEWKRWIRNAVKDGSAPDRAFRAILTSGKKPTDYRKQPRPAGWR